MGLFLVKASVDWGAAPFAAPFKRGKDSPFCALVLGTEPFGSERRSSGGIGGRICDGCT